jgi:hypothetical protein
MKIILTTISVLILVQTQGQYQFLGKSRAEILSYYSVEAHFNIKTRYVSPNQLTLIVRNKYTYPYYTFVIDNLLNECVSIGIVSKNPEVLNQYVELLNFMAEKIHSDTLSNTRIYEIRNKRAKFIYTLSQPYKRSKEFDSRKNLFYLFVEKEDKLTHLTDSEP